MILVYLSATALWKKLKSGWILLYFAFYLFIFGYLIIVVIIVEVDGMNEFKYNIITKIANSGDHNEATCVINL